MAPLTARFEIDLKGFPGYLIGESDTALTSVTMHVHDFEIRIDIDGLNAFSMGPADSQIKRFLFTRLVAVIAREFPVDELEPFRQDFFPYRKMLEQYQLALIEAVNRLISYFKFRLRNPQVRFWEPIDLLRDEKGCYGPSWSHNGKDVTPDFGDVGKKAGVVTIPGGRFLGSYGFGIEGLRTALQTDLEAYVQGDRKEGLFDELLSDAQSAVIDGNVRRSVLELAIAIEVLVKNSFFAADTVAGAAFEYVESAGGRRIRVLDLLGGASKNAFGQSFKEAAPQDFTNIDFVFRTRNSIAHRGKCQFRDDDGKIVEVSRIDLQAWWNSALSMNRWLASQIAASAH